MNRTSRWTWLAGWIDRLTGRLEAPPTPPPPAPAPQPGDPTDFELNVDLCRRFNAERSARDGGYRRPLRLSGIAAYLAAVTQATDLDARKEADPRRFHVGQDGSLPGDRLRRFGETNWIAGAENAAMAPSADAAMALWMASDAHRANILGDFDEVACARSGNYWIAAFLRRPR